MLSLLDLDVRLTHTKKIIEINSVLTMKLEAVLGPIEIRVRSGETRKMVDYSSNSLLLEEVAHLEEIRKPLLLEIRNQEIDTVDQLSTKAKLCKETIENLVKML